MLAYNRRPIIAYLWMTTSSVGGMTRGMGSQEQENAEKNTHPAIGPAPGRMGSEDCAGSQRGNVGYAYLRALLIVFRVFISVSGSTIPKYSVWHEVLLC